MTDALTALASDFQEHRLVLFAGAGVSAALGLPNWAGLIAHMAQRLGFDPEVFSSLGDAPALADHYRSTDPDLSSLLAWMEREWHDPGIDVQTSALHREIALARFPAIYTTNYDHFLEKAHEIHKVPYQVVVTGADLAALDDRSTHIVKFHGDLATRKGIVVTESDYFERLRSDTELDVKLRYDMLRYSFLFLGYSLRDVNVRAMLHRLFLFRAVNPAPNVRSYAVMSTRNEVQAALLRRWNVHPLLLRDLDVGRGVVDFLSELRTGSVAAVEVD